MLKANFTESATVITAGTDIPMSQVFTDGRVGVVNNMLVFIKCGLYKLSANLIVSGIGGDSVTLQVYRDGVPVPGALATETITGTTDIVTLPIQDAFRVVPSYLFDTATLSFRLTEDATIGGGNIVVEYK